MTYLNYNDAVEMAKRGHLIARNEWKDYGVIFFRPDDNLSRTTIPNIKSIPDKLKEYIENELPYLDYLFTGYLARYYNSIITNAWQPTTEDMTAFDWYVVK